MSKVYVCSVCGEENEKGWSDAEALAEFEARFGRKPGPEDSLVCDDCDKLMRVWMRTQQMTRHQLLDWLSQEDSSLYGECKGELLDQLLGDGAVIITPDVRGDPNYARVRLTPKGHAELRSAAEHDPAHRGIS